MRYAVILVLDAAGSTPVILAEDSGPLQRLDGVRYRLIATTNDRAEATRVAESLKQRGCASWLRTSPAESRVASRSPGGGAVAPLWSTASIP
jgi:hypothetical protein